MNFFALAVLPPQPKTQNAPKVALLFAGFVLLMAVAQLFHFEKFVPLVESFDLPGGVLVAHLFASLIVVFEVTALPFLLRMRLSPAMRFVSMLSGWLVVILWLLVQVYLNLGWPRMDNGGLLGTTISLAPGWWVVFILAALGVLSGWASWGMWPLGRHADK